jgi:hypothetical protein
MNRAASAIATALLPLVVAVGPGNPATADEKPFVRLAGKEIRAKVIGRAVTDGAHWSDYFQKDGTLVSWSQGRKSNGKWEIHGEALCIAEELGTTATCYEVWVAGDQISLRVDGIESDLHGYLRSP